MVPVSKFSGVPNQRSRATAYFEIFANQRPLEQRLMRNNYDENTSLLLRLQRCTLSTTGSGQAHPF